MIKAFSFISNVEMVFFKKPFSSFTIFLHIFPLGFHYF